MPEVSVAKPPRKWDRLLSQVQRHPLVSSATAAVVVLLLVVWGCTGGGGASRPPSQVLGRRANLRTERVSLDFVTDSLDRLHEFNPEQFNGRLVEHLNTWLLQQETAETWELDPFVQNNVLDKLPENQWQVFGFDRLGELQFTSDDGWFIQQAFWLKGVSENLRRDGDDPVAQAAALFDWTIRNIQLEDDRLVEKADLRFPKQNSWRSLLWGSAKSYTRAWIFILLARQQGLDVVMLAYPDPDAESPTDDWNRPSLRDWLPALLHDDELYLFDHRLGLPIPGPDGAAVATLSQVYQDPSLLSDLDVGSESYDAPFRSSADRPAGVTALVEASPQFVSRAMAELQAHLTGANSLVLSINPTALKNRLQQTPRVAGIEVWKWPYDCLAEDQRTKHEAMLAFKLRTAMLQLEGERERGRNADDLLSEDQKQIVEQRDQFAKLLTQIKQPKNLINNYLWRGRILQFKGQTSGERGATRTYHAGSMSQERMQNFARALGERVFAIDQALMLLESRPKNKTNLQDAEELAQLRAQLMARIEAFGDRGDLANGVLPGEAFVRHASLLYATYWLGLLAYERGDYDTAVTYFDDQILKSQHILLDVAKPAEERDDEFSKGALYNLARSYEARGRQREDQARSAEAEAGKREAQGNAQRAKAERELAERSWQEAYASYEQAVELYEEKILFEQRHGALLRARRLIERMKELEQQGVAPPAAPQE